MTFEPHDFIDISYSHFIDINCNSKGGAIYTDLQYEQFNISYSTFQNCVAEYGGAFYLQNLIKTNMNNLCLDSNVALHWNSFFVNSENSVHQCYFNLSSIVDSQEYKNCYLSSVYSTILLYFDINTSRCFSLQYSPTFILSFNNVNYPHAIFNSLFQNCSGSSLLDISHSYYINNAYFLNIAIKKDALLIALNGNISLISPLQIRNSYFYNIINSEYFLDQRTYIYNCYGDENITKHYETIQYKELKEIPNILIDCYIYSTKQNASDMTLILLCSFAGVIFIILIVTLICYCKQKRINMKNQKEMELHSSIIKEFG